MKLPLLLAGLLASAGAAAAQPRFEALCEQGGPGVRIDARDHGYRIDNRLSYKRLTNMKEPDTNHSLVLGLTRAESRVLVELDGALLSDPQSGQECIVPRLAVSVSYVPITVYIGREIPPDTCAYQEVLAHEMRHLNVYLNHLPKVESMLRAALSKRFSGRPVYAPIGQAKAALEREIDGEWIPYIKKEMERVEQLQAEIDSPQEYGRLSRVCKGEVQFLIRPPHLH